MSFAFIKVCRCPSVMDCR